MKEKAIVDSLMPLEHGAFFAGLCSGVVGVLVGQPFDTHKVHRQVGVKVKWEGVLNHVKVHYRGVVPPLLTAGFIRSLNFGIWQSCLNHLTVLDKVEIIKPASLSIQKSNFRDDVKVIKSCELESPKYSIANIFLSGIVASCFTAPITQIVNILKVQEQVNLTNKQFSYGKFIRRHNLFKPGFAPHLLLETLGSGVYYSTYYITKQYGTSIFDLEDTNIILRLISGSASGCMGWLAIYPLDTIRSRILSLPRPLSDPSINGRTLASTIYRTEGIRGFYKGILPCLLRAAPVAAFVLPTYDYVLDYFRTKE